MKNIMKLLAVVMICLSTQSFAQTFKFGHINTQEVIALMAETDSANVQLDKYSKELDEVLQGMDNEFRKKYEEYVQKQKDWLPAVLEAKEKELQEIQQRLQQYSQNAQREFEMKRQELFAPIFQKAREAIDKVGKANGFTYIFDTSVGSLVFINDNSSVNVLPLVKTELGILSMLRLFLRNMREQILLTGVAVLIYLHQVKELLVQYRLMIMQSMTEQVWPRRLSREP